MAELIDISNDKFWDILFDEACVEGQQAERIEKSLKAIATTEAQIRASAYDRFLTEMLNEFDSRNADIENHTGSYVVSRLHTVAQQLKEE